MAKNNGMLTPVGRLVMGDPFRGNTTDASGAPLVIKNGPNAGQPRTAYILGLAIPKNSPGWPDFAQFLRVEATTAFPQLPAAQGNPGDPNFAWKVTDGDSTVPNQNGVVPNTREGYPGCWVVRMSSGMAPKCMDTTGHNVLTDPESIRRGYFIRVYVTVSGNASVQSPGLYINPSIVQMIAYGDLIQSGPDASALLGAAPVGALPAGATTTPPTPAAAPAPPVPSPTAGVQPVTAFTTPPPAPPVAPPTPPTPPAPPVAASRMYQGVAHPESDLVKWGWTPEQIGALPLA